MNTVHILNGGQPFCGTVTGMPMTWPIGHTWVTPELIPDKEMLKKKNSSMCFSCLTALKRAKEIEKK